MSRIIASLLAALVSFFAIQPMASQASGTPMIIEVLISDLNQDGTLSDDEARAGVPLEGTVSVSVDWGDSVTESFTTPGFKSHVYSASGTYQISITGSLSHWGFTGNAADKDDGGGLGSNGASDDEMAKITRVLQWGDLGLTKLEYGFSSAANLVDVPTDFPALVTDAHALFISATSFNDPDVTNWDVSGLQVFRSMFWRASSFDQPIGGWDTSAATDMSYMFIYATTFNQPLSNWDTSNVTDFRYMFFGAESFDQSVGTFSFASIVSTSDVLRLDQANLSPATTTTTLESWAQTSQPADLEVLVDGFLRSAIPAANILENTYGWNLGTSFLTGVNVNIRPSRTHVNGYSGLRAEFLGPVLNEVDLGAQFDSFDSFGRLTLIDPQSGSPSDWTFDDENFVDCTPVLDGEEILERGQEVHGNEFVIECQSAPVSIGGGTVELEVRVEVAGSFIRYTVDVANVTGTIGDLEVRFGGDLGSDTDALIHVLPGNTQVIATEDEDFDDPVIAFTLSEPFSAIRSGSTTSTLNDLDGDDDLYFDFGAKTIQSGSRLVDLEMAFIDYHPQDLSVDQAVEFAEEILATQESIFGMCLPVVRDGAVPELIDECVTHADRATPINFAKLDSDQAFVDVGEPSVAGEEFLFENAATIDGQQINARVRIDNLAQMEFDELQDLDESGDDYQAEWHEWYLRVDAYSSADATETRAELTISFEDTQGNPYVVDELFLNAYDVDENQYVEFAAFQEYSLDSNTILNVRAAESGWTRFEELNGVGTSTNTADPRTITRVKVRYEGVTQIRLALGQTIPDDAANFYFDFSAGVSWESLANPDGLEPVTVTNFVDLPLVTASPYAGPLVYSVTDGSVGEAVTVTGERLNMVTAVEVDGTQIDVATQNSSELSFVVPVGITPGTKDLTLVGSFGKLVAQQAFTITDEVNPPAMASAWTKLQSDGKTVKFYSKKVVGAGKIQFFADGLEVAWINAIDDSDSKISVVNGAHYMVRSFTLRPGKNRLEISVEGQRVWRATYVPKE